MLPGMCSLDLGLNIVDGVRALSPKGDGHAGAVQVAPARSLPGLHEPPRHGCRRRMSSMPSAPCSSSIHLGSLRTLPSPALPSPAAGVAATDRALVRGTEVPTLLYTDK